MFLRYMNPIEWNKNMSVGNFIIDEQHKELIDSTKHLYLSLKDGNSYRNQREALQFLVNYTYNHFKSEEELLLKVKYPRIQNHILEHEYFKGRIKDYVEKINNDKMILSIDIVNFLNLWIINHIKFVDRDYMNYIYTKIQ